VLAERIPGSKVIKQVNLYFHILHFYRLICVSDDKHEASVTQLQLLLSYVYLYLSNIIDCNHVRCKRNALTMLYSEVSPAALCSSTMKIDGATSKT